MIDLQHYHQNGLFLQRPKGSVTQFIRVLRDDLKVFRQAIRRVCVNQSDPVLQLQARLREIAPIKRTNDCAAAEGV